MSEKVELLEKIVQLQEKLLAVPVQKKSPKKARSFLTPAEKSYILHHYKSGFSAYAIAKDLNRSGSVIRRFLKRNGVN